MRSAARCYSSSATDGYAERSAERINRGTSYPTRLGGLFFQRGLDLVVFWKYARLQLRIDLCPINDDLEAAVIVRHEGQVLNALFVVAEQIVRQTDGFWLIASRCAVFDPNIHTTSLKSVLLLIRFSFVSSLFSHHYHSPGRCSTKGLRKAYESKKYPLLS